MKVVVLILMSVALIVLTWLTTVSPVLVAICGILFYNFTGFVWRFLSEKKKVKFAAGFFLLLVFARLVTIYALLLSFPIVGIPLVVLLIFAVIVGLLLAILDKEKIKIPAPIIWVRKVFFVATIGLLLYFLLK